MKRATQEFSRFAGSYGRHNRIQAKVAAKLVSMLPEKRYGSIIDIGCGSGEVYRNLRSRTIEFDSFVAVDIADEMLHRHPSESSVMKVQGDFNRPESMSRLPRRHYDLLLSASALQWSSDLDMTLSMLANLSDRYYFAIFTSATFRSLHHYAGVTSPIYSESLLREKIALYYNASFETVRYTLPFESVYKMLRYIKESGTSGGERHLGYAQTKHLLENYPYTYLEFEVLFVSPKS